MRRLSSMAILLLVTFTYAQLTPVGPSIEGVPGEFVSVSFVSVIDTGFLVEAPEFLTLMGTPIVDEGRVSVFLYVGLDAPAGAHEITLRAPGVEETRVTVLVARRTELRLSATTQTTVVQGDPVTLSVTLNNLGNASETVEVRAISRFDLRQTLHLVNIDPGETTEVQFYSPGTSGAGEDVAVISATPASDATARRSVVIRTSVLPFAGAHDGRTPSMRYGIQALETYGTAGWRTKATAQLEGRLSDSVDGKVALSIDWPAGSDAQVAGSASLSGDDWSVRYRAATHGQRLDAHYQDVTGFAYLIPNGYGVGVAYLNGGFIVSASHASSTADTQVVSAGYSFAVTPEIVLTPALTGIRSTADGVSLTANASLSATVNTAAVLGALRIETPLPVSDAWRISGAIASRTHEPLAYRAEFAVTSETVTGNVTFTEVLNDEVLLQQRISYNDGGRVAFGVRYSPRWLLLSLGATGELNYESDQFGASFVTTLSYLPSPYSINVYVRGDVGGATYYGGSVGYHTGALRGSLAYRKSATSNEISGALSFEHEEFTGSAGYSYDFTSYGHAARFSVDYQSQEGHVYFGSIGLSQTFVWEVGARLTLTGGFATPDVVVAAFGGREGGVVSGVVFHDVNRNGQRELTEPPLSSATVHLGTGVALSDETGAYRVFVPSGTYLPRLSGMPASLRVVDPRTILVAPNSAQELDMPVQTVATVIVSVFEDANLDGVRDATDGPVPEIVVKLEAEGQSGGSYDQRTNERGEAIFQGVAPGRYVAHLPVASLPSGREITTGSLTTDIGTGPANRLELGVAFAPPEVVRTLESGDLTMFAAVDPSPAPAGADVLVTVSVSHDDVLVTAVIPGQTGVELGRDADGIYRGRLTLPADAKGVAIVTVAAESVNRRLEQSVPLVVSDGPLARVSVTPAFAEPGETLQVRVTLLTLARDVLLRFEGEMLTLEAATDPYQFTGAIRAPNEAGTYLVEAIADGVKLAESRFRVQ